MGRYAAGAVSDASESQPQAVPFAVAFVCIGNQARSPLSEALLRAKIGAAPIVVSSFGTSPLPPKPPLRGVVAVGRKLGVDVGAHRSRPLVDGCLDGVGLVIGFEPFHVAASVIDAGAARERSFLVRELVALLDEWGDARSRETIDLEDRIVALHGLRVGRLLLSTYTMSDPAGAPYEVFEALGHEVDGITTRVAADLIGASNVVR